MFDALVLGLMFKMIYKQLKIEMIMVNWIQEESKSLLETMVDTANQGCRDNNGAFTKQIMEDKILLALDSKLGCIKIYNHYYS